MKNLKKVLVTIITVLVLGFSVFYWHTLTRSESPIITNVQFEDLPNWGNKTIQNSFKVFQNSCRVFIRQDPNKPLSSDIITMKVADILPACQSAMTIKTISPEKAQAFFRQWFQPVEVRQANDDPTGLFTGYYAPLLKGSLTKTDKYQVPIYTLPNNLLRIRLRDFDDSLDNKSLVGRIDKHHFVPYHDRKAINQGALKQVPVLAWVNNRVDRLFLEIQGSGMIQLDNGETLYAGYAGQNGLPYTALAGALIEDGYMTRDNASMQAIRQFFENHPDKINHYLHKNQSFVFFKDLKQKGAIGAQGIVLTPGYSLAVDRQYVPMGMPIWLSTTYPDKVSDNHLALNRLMIAQDTGGAIKGAIRGDVYWGAGEQATFTAGHMKNPGRWWLLLPKQVMQPFPLQ